MKYSAKPEFSFPAAGVRRGYVLILQGILREKGSELLEEGRVEFDLEVEKRGYPGSVVFLIDSIESRIRVEKYSGDPTRFPARLKACARALWLHGFSGRFHITHRNGKFSIITLPSRQTEPLPQPDPERLEHLDHFYSLLDDLEEKVGGKYQLADCSGRMDWPSQGVYHFFEDGELRQKRGGMRVVRVGTHAVSRGSRATLWNRLSAHRGHLGGVHEGGGNHRGSVFRRHIGTSLIQRNNLDSESWGQGSSAIREVRDREYEIEIEVSRHIRAMPFLWIKASDEAGPRSVRAYLERNSIAILSNYEKPQIDPPSSNWLGNYCPNRFIRSSCLWNVRHVKDKYNPRFLESMEKLIRSM